jgi:osmotically-inducible protein OsmY
MSHVPRSEGHSGLASEPESYLLAHLQEAFATDPRVNQLDVKVTVTGDKVFLTGRVATEQRREAVAEVAAELLPDYEVHNQTRVYDLSPAPEAEPL